MQVHERTHLHLDRREVPAAGTARYASADTVPAVSRGAIQRLIEQGHIKVNGQIVKPTTARARVMRSKSIGRNPAPPRLNPKPSPSRFSIEDKDLLVLNKAPGVVVHPSAGHEEHTLVNALLHHCKGKLSGIGGVLRPGIVHRLDKETSGCLIVAEKRQRAPRVVRAVFPTQPGKDLPRDSRGRLMRASGDIRAAIGRHPSHRKRMAVTEQAGREAWDDLPRSRTPRQRHACRSPAAHGAHAPDPGPFSAHRVPAAGRPNGTASARASGLPS